MIERGAPHRSYAGQTEIGLLVGFEEKRGYLSLKLDALSFNLVSVRACWS